jgi:hypothetical protein
VLDGFESVAVDQAYDFAFERFPARVLVDSSKRVYWARRFVQSKRAYEICLIHLIRDPRGWFASERRRTPGALPELLKQWVREQYAISSFLNQSGVACETAVYDELASDPEPQFSRLCSRLQVPFTSESLRYWHRPQHGFAANGASSFLLGFDGQERGTVTTGDDPYYVSHDRQLFFDSRWRTQLSDEERNEIEANAGVQHFLLSCGRNLSREGLQLAS